MRDEHSSREATASGRRDSNEQIGDIYGVNIDEQGHIDQVEKVRVRPQIWVGFWADYNDGILHGRWLDAPREPAELQIDIDAMLAASPTARRTGIPSEDWGVFDHDGFGAFRLGEQPTLALVSKIAQGIIDHGLAYAAFAALHESEDLSADFETCYLGHYDSAEAYADDLVADLGYEAAIDRAVPEGLRPYVRIDGVALARDMQLGGDIHVEPASDGGVWIFGPV